MRGKTDLRGFGNLAGLEFGRIALYGIPVFRLVQTYCIVV